MIDHLLALHRPWIDRAALVVHPSARAAVARHLAGAALPVDLFEQERPTGMLDAILLARPAVERWAPDRVRVTWCDQIAIRPETVAIESIYRLAAMTVWLYVVCIFVWVILSWLQSAYHPISIFLGQLIEPVLRPARRLLPAAGGFDVSPMIVTILLVAILIALGDLRTILLARANGLY